jgi:ABC-type sugar transport system ATPase subunit
MKDKLEERSLKTVTIGMRPQYLNIQGGEGKEALAGKVSVFEFLGETGNLTITNNGLDINLVAPPDIGLDEGEPTEIYYDPNKVLLFDSESGKNIFYEPA